MSKNYSGKNKNTARSMATNFTGKPITVGLFLPSGECRCLKEMIKNGSLTNRTKVILAIEKDHKTANKIEAYFVSIGRKIGKDCELHRGPANTAPIGAWVKKYGMIDFSFLDFCGMMDIKMSRWLQSFKGNEFVENCPVFFTFNIQERANRLCKAWLAEEVENVIDHPLHPFVDSVNEGGDEKQAAWISVFSCALLKSMFAYEIKVLSAYTYKDIEEGQTKGAPMALYSTVLKKGAASEETQEEIKDLCIKAENFNKKETGIPTIKLDISKALNCGCVTASPVVQTAVKENIVQKVKNPLRVAAANKAWVTMRQNALNKKRHEAANKAWVTRRANAAR